MALRHTFMKIGLVFLLLLLPFVAEAEPPIQQSAFGDINIQCPSTVTDVHILRLHEFTAPSGWADDPQSYGSYSGASLKVNGHYLSPDGKELKCTYGAKSGISDYALIRIVKSKPSGMTCTKGENYTFHCKKPLLRRR